MAQVEVLTTSELAVPPDVVWERVASLEGVNHELGPWMRMTAPAGAERSLESVPLGERWFRSWILLFGVIPFDYDDLCLVRMDPPHGFLERSKMLSASVWEHERTIEPVGSSGARITDRVSFVPRLQFAARLHHLVIVATFHHRHRRLRRYFERG